MGHGERIKRERLAREWSLQRLADLAGMKKSTLHDIESGTTQGIDGQHLINIAKVLGSTPEWIMSGKSSKRGDLTPEQIELLDDYNALTKSEQESLRAFLRAIHDSRIVEPPPPKKEA